MPGEQFSDVIGNLTGEPYFTGVRALAAPTQRLTFQFNPILVGPYTGTFELLVGSGATAPISFSSADLPTSAANIQAALVSLGYTGTLVTVVGETSAATYGFNITLDGAAGESGLPPIQYVGGVPSTVAFSNSATAASTSQQLTFNAALVPVQQFTELTVGTVTTAPIYFDSTNPANTAAAIKTALVNAGFAGANVLVDAATTATDFIFDVSFFNPHAPIGIALNMAVTSSPTVVAVPTSTATTALQFATTDPYTQQADPDYSNPQYDPSVAMGPEGQFVIVWSNLGQDLSWFNNVSMERYDENGNGLAFVGSVGNSGPTNYDFFPDVAMGDDGMVVVTYTETADAAVLNGISAADTVFVRGYNAQSAPLWDSYDVGGGGESSISMDEQDNFVVSWDVAGGTDPLGFNGEDQILGAEYQLESYQNPSPANPNGDPTAPSTGIPLAQPLRLRPVNPPDPTPTPPQLPASPVGFRFNSADPTSSLPPGYPTSTLTWPLGDTGSSVQTDADGDIAASFNGNGPDVADNISIPNTFFEQYFSQEVQKLTFTGVVPGDVFGLDVGSSVTAPITFGTTAASTAPLIQNQLDILLAGLGFDSANATFIPVATVTGTQSGTTWTFTVTFGVGPNEPVIGYVGALSGVAFTNSATTPSATQQLTFTATGATLTNGLFTLTTALGATTGPIVFDADPTNGPTITAEDIQAALPGATVTVDPTSTATAFVFDVTYATAQPVLKLGTVANVLPSTAYAATVVTAWNNADLLAYFNPFQGDAVGSTSTFANMFTSIYQAASGDNDNVQSAIDQVLYAAQYTPTAGIASANQDQLGRLQSVLQTVAGALSGESAGILLTQFDANSEDSQNATFSDSVVSTQRSGQDQEYYLVVPADVQGGSFQIRFTFGILPNRYTTAVINMPSTGPNCAGRADRSRPDGPKHRQRHQRPSGHGLAGGGGASFRLCERARGSAIGDQPAKRIRVCRPRRGDSRRNSQSKRGAAARRNPLAHGGPGGGDLHVLRVPVDLSRTGARHMAPELCRHQQQYHAMGVPAHRGHQRSDHLCADPGKRESGADIRG